MGNKETKNPCIMMATGCHGSHKLCEAEEADNTPYCVLDSQCQGQVLCPIGATSFRFVCVFTMDD